MMIVSGGVAIGGFTEEEEAAGRDRTTKGGRQTHPGIGKEQKNIQIISRNGIFFSSSSSFVSSPHGLRLKSAHALRRRLTW